MTRSYSNFCVLATLLLGGAACTPTGAATQQTDQAEQPQEDAQLLPSNTPLPATDTSTPVPSDTPLPPTDTAVPPTAAATALPVVMGEEQTADGCSIVALNPAAWQPLYRAYNPGSDPFFHIHTMEPGFFFGAELYTVYGPGWTGELGTFATDCTANGICIYLAPVQGSLYLADKSGQIEIVSLLQTDNVLQLPVEFILHQVTFQPAPGGSASGCVYVEEVKISIPVEN